ncbi:MAG: hypothetical protein ABIK92_13260 [Pseudomonadota bacterium]
MSELTLLTKKELCYLYKLSKLSFKTGSLLQIGTSCLSIGVCLGEVAKECSGTVYLVACSKNSVDIKECIENDCNKDLLKNIFGSLSIEKQIKYIKFSEIGDHPVSKEGFDLIVIDIDIYNNNAEIAGHLEQYLCEGGVVLLCNKSEDQVAYRMSEKKIGADSGFRAIQGEGRFRCLKKNDNKNEMILCTGMQSGGSTLVSWCFLQRPDMSGILDMWSEGILLMPYTNTELAWCKMTTSCFRWNEVADFYSDQGWRVRPLLVVRDVRSAYSSLRNKSYGLNGTTAEDPPLRIRFKRFLFDWQQFRENNWPIIRFESLITESEVVLRKCCEQLGISFIGDMITWPKPISEIEGVGVANETFKSTVYNGGLFKSILTSEVRTKTKGIAPKDMEWLESTFNEYNRENEYPLHVPLDQPSEFPDHPQYHVTKHYENEVLVRKLNQHKEKNIYELNRHKDEINNIKNSKYWKVYSFLNNLLKTKKKS